MDFDEANWDFSISAKSIAREFICAVCFDEIKDAYMTPCGHNFCFKCIDECLNRQHLCPICSKACVVDQLIKNFSLDNILRTVSQERLKASSRYFGDLLHSDGQRPKNPIEEVFERRVKPSLLSFTHYLEEGQSRADVQRRRLKNMCVMQILQLPEWQKCAPVSEQTEESIASHLVEGALGPEISARLSTLLPLSEQSSSRLELIVDDWLSQVTNLNGAVDRSVKFLVSNFDTFLEKVAISPNLLPISVTVTIPTRNVRFELQLKPTDNGEFVKESLSQWMEKSGNPVEQYGSDVSLLLKFPVPLTAAPSSALVVVTETLAPLSVFGIMNGTEVQVQGSVRLRSDEYTRCYSLAYVPGKAVDYFSCKECSVNWLCKACTERCHSGHTITPFQLSFVPDWNCCYCYKKKTCKIPNSKKPGSS